MRGPTNISESKIETFIRTWSASEGAERSNFQPFATALCEILGVEKPHVAGTQNDTYTFEHTVKFKQPDGKETSGFIDLYKKGAFVLEAKQSREKDRKKAIPGQSDLFVADPQPRGQRSAKRSWDVLMDNARRQAEGYAKALPVADGWPPFVLVCDVGHCIEIYADFSGQGKHYKQFPDRNSYRVYMEDLRDAEVRERLRLIWEDPKSLDPTRRSAKVTRDIAKRLADVSKRLKTMATTLKMSRCF